MRPRPASRDEGQKGLEPAKKKAGVPLTVLRLVLPAQSGGLAQDPVVNRTGMWDLRYEICDYGLLTTDYGL